MISSRAIAAHILCDVHRGRSLDDAFCDHLTKANKNDISLIKASCFGVLRHHYSLLAWLNSLLSKPLKSKQRMIQELLLVGLYQLHYMRVADHAAIHSCVEAAKHFKQPFAAKLVNAILRQSQRVPPKEPDNLQERFDHPLWFIEQLQQDWPNDWEAILLANNQAAPMTLRVNLQKTSRQAYLAQLAEAEIKASANETCDTAITLQKPVDVEALPGFSAGLCSVQSITAQQAATLLQLQAGQKVLDACAAPGGKACHALEQQPDLDLLALDISEQRLALLGNDLKRLNLKATLQAIDALQFAQTATAASFDRILLDAPCSASGVIRRHPDIKQLKTAADITALQQTQQRLLNALWPLLKPSGLLLYCTCSVLDSENQQQINQFIQNHPNASVEPINNANTKTGQQYLPNQEHDGFYYALLRKAAG